MYKDFKGIVIKFRLCSFREWGSYFEGDYVYLSANNNEFLEVLKGLYQAVKLQLCFYVMLNDACGDETEVWCEMSFGIKTLWKMHAIFVFPKHSKWDDTTVQKQKTNQLTCFQPIDYK